VQDLHDRGLDKDVSVVVWGEFGRTPTINASAGRDHWPRVNSALLACGGMKTGQVIGATDKQAGEVVDRPVTFGDIHATLLHNLGIDPHVSIPDAQGRLQRPVTSEANPIAELVG
jgi:arylsulfatase A-like enzyme